jgi:peroxiredoxin
MVLLVEFFESSAGSRSLADAAALYTKDRELVIVGISLDDSIERTRAFVAEQSVRFPVLFDPERAVAARVGVTEAGTSLAVDRRGILRWVGDPRKPGAVEQATRALLDEPA